MGSGLVNAWRRLEDFDFGSLSYPALRGRTGSTIDPRLDPLNSGKPIWTTDFRLCLWCLSLPFVIPTCVRADYKSVTNAKGLSVDIPAPAVYVAEAVKLSRRRWAASHDRGRCG